MLIICGFDLSDLDRNPVYPAREKQTGNNSSRDDPQGVRKGHDFFRFVSVCQDSELLKPHVDIRMSASWYVRLLRTGMSTSDLLTHPSPSNISSKTRAVVAHTDASVSCEKAGLMTRRCFFHSPPLAAKMFGLINVISGSVAALAERCAVRDDYLARNIEGRRLYDRRTKQIGYRCNRLRPCIAVYCMPLFPLPVPPWVPAGRRDRNPKGGHGGD